MQVFSTLLVRRRGGVQSQLRNLSGARQQRSHPSSSSTGGNGAGKKSAAGTVLFGVMSLITAGLGVWQSQRYNWKVNWIEETKRQMTESPLEWKNIKDSGHESLRGRKIILQGKFDHSKEIRVGPRPPPAGVFGPAAQGMATNPIGYYIVTPFYDDNGEVFLINRGWVARNATSWSRPLDERISLLVLCGEMEKRGTFSPVNDVKSKTLLWLEHDAVLQATGLEAKDDSSMKRPSLVFESIVDDVSNPGSFEPKVFPVPKLLSKAHEVYVEPPTHVAYAVTWFSLSIAASVIAYRFHRKSSSARKAVTAAVETSSR